MNSPEQTGTVEVRGPGTPFSCLHDETKAEGPGLPPAFREIYASDWCLPQKAGPYVYSNFVISRDGRVSFNEPGHLGGGDVSGYHAHDIWLMALLRARADAILVGDNTLNLEPAHVWTPDHVFDADAAAFAQLRQREDRRPTPLQVFLSLHGYIDFEAEVFKRDDLHVVIATTTAGAASLASRPDVAAEVDILELGSAQVDPRGLTSALAVEYNVRTLLCEGGPRAYGSLLAANCVDDEFLSLSPIVIGASQTAPRPSLVEGIAFSFHNHPTAKLLTVHRAENHLFLRSRYKHDEE